MAERNYAPIMVYTAPDLTPEPRLHLYTSIHISLLAFYLIAGEGSLKPCQNLGVLGEAEKALSVRLAFQIYHLEDPTLYRSSQNVENRAFPTSAISKKPSAIFVGRQVWVRSRSYPAPDS